MEDNKKATIDQVAREAGVSTQTVSRVLNNRPDVSPATRARIKEVMRQLGYQPNAIARSLASRRTRTLALITDDFSDYFFMQVIAGAEEEARKNGYMFMLGSTERNPQDEPEYIRLFGERQVEGFLFAHSSTEPNERNLADLVRTEAPVVSVAYHLPGDLFSLVDVDNFLGGQLAARYLLERGHNKIATIEGPSGWKAVADRSAGFGHELQLSDGRLNEHLIGKGDWSYVSGYRAMQQLLETGEEFTALFAHNDQMAIGAMRALREAGRHIPVDVSVIGYDDIPAAEYSDPPLTTIHQPSRELGAAATRLLIRAIEHKGQPADVLLLAPELIRRSS